MPDDIYKLLEQRHLNSIHFSMKMGIGPEDFKSLMQTIGKTKEELEAEWIRDHPMQNEMNLQLKQPDMLKLHSESLTKTLGDWYVDDELSPNVIYICDGDVIRFMYEELWLGIKHNKDCKGFRNRKEDVH